MTYVVASGGRAPVMISTISPEALGAQLAALASSAPSSAAWPGGDVGIFIPFVLTQTVTVVKLWTLNGATASDNTDIGIYDEAYARKVSIGPTAQSGTSTIQEFNIADTVLTPGRYYLACSNSGSTGTYIRYAPGIPLLKAMGCFNQSSVGTLPSTATPVVVANDYLPVVGLSIRTLVA